MKRDFRVIENRGCGISYEVKSGLTRFQAQYLANSLAKDAPLNGDGYPFDYSVEREFNGATNRQEVVLCRILMKLGLPA